jgi:superfamily II DNA or RNA helicase
VKLELSEDNKYLIVVEASDIEIEQLRICLTRKVNGWRFHPLVKQGHWDGNVSYFLKDRFIPAGLWREILDICKKFNYEIEIEGIRRLFDNSIKMEEFEAWVKEYFNGFNMEIRQYQIEAAYQILKNRLCVAELATSAGKTLISYIIVSYLLQKEKAQKILFIVPSVSLVTQGVSDFKSYTRFVENPVKIKYQEIYSGQAPKPEYNLVIGTYQSLSKKPKEYFEGFDAVIVDETHKVKAQSIKQILEKCTNSVYRFGLSGTIPKPETLDRLTLMSYTGPLITEVSANYLASEGFVTKCRVQVIEMDYASEEVKMAFSSLSRTPNRKELYQMEQDFIVKNDERLNFIANIIGRSTKSSLVLFHRIEHGQKLYKLLREKFARPIYYVDGGTDAEIRDVYKDKMEKGENVILIASFGTFSTGISIKNIHNIFFTESFKSEVIVRQSIGRGLRLHKDKDLLTIIDFVDNFSYDGWDGYLYKHGKERQKIYKEQKFAYAVKQVKF